MTGRYNNRATIRPRSFHDHHRPVVCHDVVLVQQVFAPRDIALDSLALYHPLTTDGRAQSLANMDMSKIRLNINKTCFSHCVSMNIIFLR